LGLLWLLRPVAASASADAGVRSIFAYGAGNRALAMGGAYAAIADDASAPLWNPGGLGFVQRRTFDVSYASLYGLGFQEQYASFVLPSWRFGAGAISFQQFSVDGIERRDARNFLLGDDESDSQTQFSFSFGRPFGEIWSLGAALKVRRHALAGFSDTGIGVDVGVLLRPALALGSQRTWAQRLGFGFAVQNVVQPTLRLDQSSVEDPPTARAGFSYWLPLGRANVLTALDFEKTDGMDLRAHWGVEARVHSILSLRLGVNAGHLAAGTGIHWRDLSFDYVYEDNEIESVHRFGAAFRFGLSVAESRQVALEAQEAALTERLAEEFHKRQEAQVRSLLDETEGLRADGQIDAALELLNTLRLLAPDDARVHALEAACMNEKAQQLETEHEYARAALVFGQVLLLRPGDPVASAGQARCQSLSDRRAARTQQIRTEFVRAMEAFTAEDFAAARNGFSAVLELNPGDSEAYEMLERTRQACARRTSSLLELAEHLLADGVLAEAEQLALQVRAMDPDAEGLASLERRMASAKRAAQAQVQAQAGRTGHTDPDHTTLTPARPSLSPERRKEVEELYRRGVSAMEEGRSADAVRYWELVWSFDPDYERVREHLKREYMTLGLEEFAQGSLEAAIERWQKALQVDPTDPRARAYLQRAQEQLSRTRQILGPGD
jgi:tetratricopeptide (TPR) repeat protein